MYNDNVYLTYIEWDGNLHKSTTIDNKGLSVKEIQNAIDIYSSRLGELSKDNKRLGNLVSELLNENKYLKRYYDDYLDKSAGN